MTTAYDLQTQLKTDDSKTKSMYYKIIIIVSLCAACYWYW